MRTNIETQKSIILDYKLSTLSLKNIAEKYNVSHNTVKKIIILNGEKMRDFKVNRNIEEEIICDYNNGITNKELTIKYNLHRSTIQTILLRNNIKLKSLGETARKHQLVDEYYFNKIDTEEKAYILGLLYADGSIRYNGFEISLVEGDKELLDKLSNIMYNKIILGYKGARIFETKSKKYMSKPQYRLIITSNIMKDDLIRHGCVQAKTFKISLPKLDDDLYKHFIRGYFDGDGCITMPKRQPNTASINITSNIHFCNELTEYIRKTINVDIKTKIRYGNVGAIYMNKTKQVIYFMNWLYDNSTIYLERKYNKFQNFKLNYISSNK